MRRTSASDFDSSYDFVVGGDGVGAVIGGCVVLGVGSLELSDPAR
jgi:hypothetical protein